ncbi:hypothetical protein BDN72DRAFT_895212 [Pluteus cervinus]|uniref:Uncharacterized protein n=1 Tax=Pluteus cervinus TaxID=181527 RepID=A0ACD3B2X8_9AGAR|nr:hypothetical protein BDN72DRAFT_895212 [Pluteus cervinus]
MPPVKSRKRMKSKIKKITKEDQERICKLALRNAKEFKFNNSRWKRKDKTHNQFHGRAGVSLYRSDQFDPEDQFDCLLDVQVDRLDEERTVADQAAMRRNSPSQNPDELFARYDKYRELEKAQCDHLLEHYGVFQHDKQTILIVEPPEPHVEEQIPPAALFDFYDRHTAEHLRLKHLSFQPSLHDNLAHRVDSKLDELRDVGLGVPETAPETSQKWRAGDSYLPSGHIYPKDLALRFQEVIGNITGPAASHWVISPRAPYSFLHVTCYSWRMLQDTKHSAKNYPWEGVSLQFQEYDHLQREGKLLSWLDVPTREFLKAQEGSNMISFIFLPYSSQSADILRDMDRLFTLPEFPSSCCATVGYSATHSPSTRTAGIDALKTPWLVRESRQDPESPDAQRQEDSNDNGVLLPDGGRPADFGKDGAVTAEGLLHHVRIPFSHYTSIDFDQTWRKAVERDTTFIVFNCGDFERIGVRHRATQTLYLSELIEVATAQNPAYSKIHLGLDIAALEDAQDRYDQIQRNTAKRSARVPRSNLGKRKREEIDVPPDTETRFSRRAWLKVASRNLSETMDHSHSKTKDLWKELHSRSLALVLIQYNIFESPRPASFLRIGGTLSPHGLGPRSKKWKKTYKSLDSLKVTLDHPLFRGSGRIHTTIIELELSDGRMLTRRVMAKVATTPADRAQLKHEYSVYEYLWERKVNGISCIFGLFEDVDNLATILIMERGGITLLTREPWVQALENAVKLSEREKYMCLPYCRLHANPVLPEGYAFQSSRKSTNREFSMVGSTHGIS